MNAQGRATTRHAGDDLDRTAFQAIGCAGAKGYCKARLEGYQPATSEHFLLVHILHHTYIRHRPEGKRQRLLLLLSGSWATSTSAVSQISIGQDSKLNFPGHILNEFVRDAALPYLEHDSPEVRKEAVLASTQLLINDPICHQTSAHSVEIVSDVLEKLLTVGITDPSMSLSGPRNSADSQIRRSAGRFSRA